MNHTDMSEYFVGMVEKRAEVVGGEDEETTTNSIPLPSRLFHLNEKVKGNTSTTQKTKVNEKGKKMTTC